MLFCGYMIIEETVSPCQSVQSADHLVPSVRACQISERLYEVTAQTRSQQSRFNHAANFDLYMRATILTTNEFTEIIESTFYLNRYCKLLYNRLRLSNEPNHLNFKLIVEKKSTGLFNNQFSFFGI